MATSTWTTWTSTTSSTTTTTSATGSIWYDWNDTSAAATTTATNATCDTWVIWTIGASEAGQISDHIWSTIKKPTHSERMQSEIWKEWNSHIRAEKKVERDSAEKKAKDLLLDLIGEDELKIYEKTGRLFVKGKNFDYIVVNGGKVQKIEKDKITDLCVHLAERSKYAPTDNVISLKLAIEAEEDKVLQLANNHGSRDLPERLPLAACM